ncbi:hypothetical protein PFICI_02430 [Pestalotiopsis fici W106-1]|uniref:Uncharacterized protein n=1 Tax=Pestalotiopsis fici (strain W106-1 / CGMCC3.15140) TaxID=1229662 RepID=W3XEC7_PESFW|nr:uncharacterized protein PFICI_02430 [Pestalotiopsis fici W106-1]ETS84405.1 hypothetical protein PFICI_02430 [Pestalotiopsis fici W106-1]
MRQMAAESTWSSVFRRAKSVCYIIGVWILFPLMFTFALYSLLAPVFFDYSKHPTRPDTHKSIPVTGTREMIFSEHENYMNLSHEHDMLWMDLLTPNGGFVKRPDRHGVERKNGISMFHQLHCLGMMREAVQSLTERLAAAEAGMSSSSSSHSSRRAAMGGSHGLHDPEAEPDHWLHCFDYLRQVSFCNFVFYFLSMIFQVNLNAYDVD